MATNKTSQVVNLTEKFLHRDMLISADYAEKIVNSALANSHVTATLAENNGDMSYFGYFREPESLRYTLEGEIAVIPVNGAMFPGADYSYEWGTGYDFIVNGINQANADFRVKKILLAMRTPGGTVDGAFEALDAIRESAKPIETFAVHAYSAGYLLASGTSKITVPSLGGVGSIGVITTHVDFSKMMEDNGVKVTLIYKGDRKADGNPYEPLKAEVKKRIEDRLETTYEAFVQVVADGRAIDSQAVRDTEAGVFGATEALSLRLVDAVGKLRDQLGSNVTAGQIGNLNTGNDMASSQGAADANTGNQQEQQATTQVDLQTAISQERERFSAILACDEAADKQKLAMTLAKQGMSLDQAKEILKVAGSETATVAQTQNATTETATTNHFTAAMSRPENSQELQDLSTSTAPNANDPTANRLYAAALEAGVVPKN